MGPTVWHDLDPDHGVLELPELVAYPAPLLELHIARDSETGEAVAWWTDDRVSGLRVVQVAKG
jgi:hypothetical protein